MGKNTFLSIPEKYRPLKDRKNFIIIKNNILKKKYKNIEIIDINNLLNIFNYNYDEYWIIGGEQLYKYILNTFTNIEIHITIINNNYNCNKFFPIISDSENYIKLNTIENINDNYIHYVYKMVKHHNKDYP